MNIRLLSYNVHKGIGGVDRKYHPQRIIDVIRSLNPDIVFLQEVDNGVARSQHHRQVDLFADGCGIPYRAYQGNVRVKAGEYGNAILSRFRLQGIHHLDLTLRYRKNRRALIATCELDNLSCTNLLLANCHLGLAEYERRRQIQSIVTHLSQVRPLSAVVVGGDLNDVWSSLERRILEPQGFVSAAPRAATFPAIRPLRTLDKLFVRGNIEVNNTFVGHSDLARVASDHLPIVADLTVADPTSANESLPTVAAAINHKGALG